MRESWNTSIAAPIAVSIWITFGLELSPGSTFFSLRISGRPRMLSRRSISSRMRSRSNQRLLVEQNLCRSRSASASLSFSAVCAVSRSTMRPSALRRAKWPPLRSEGVRRTASIANGAPDSANQPATRASGTAPRLSELDTNA